MVAAEKLERVDSKKTKYLVSEHVFLSKPNCLFEHFSCGQPLMRIKYFLEKLKAWETPFLVAVMLDGGVLGRREVAQGCGGFRPA